MIHFHNAVSKFGPFVVTENEAGNQSSLETQRGHAEPCDLLFIFLKFRTQVLFLTSYWFSETIKEILQINVRILYSWVSCGTFS